MASSSSKRRWVFRLATAVAVPVLLLAGIEGLLRVVGFGAPTAFTLNCRFAGIGRFCSNPRFTWRFFPPTVARAPLSFAIPKEKDETTYRIFLLGGSAAQGDPDQTFGISRALDVLLRHQYPGVRFEVVNTAITAINSHVVLAITRDLARRDGDLFIVYLGNNEVVGSFGPGSAFAPLSRSLPLIRASVRARATRTGQLFAGSLSFLGGEDKWSEWRGMEMFLEHRIRADDPLMEQVYSHFEGNLKTIVDVARGSGAEVILSTVATNVRDSAPFASLNRPDLAGEDLAAWENHFRAGVEHEAEGRPDAALEAFRLAEEIDASHAELQYRVARIYWLRGEPAEALSRYVRARDLDALRFRADSRINDVIRTVAGARGVPLLDAEAIIESNSPSGVPGIEWFHDHVHLNFSGNYLVARGLLDLIAEMLPERFRVERADQQPLTLEDSAARLAYTGFDRHRIAADMLNRFSRPPFTNQFDHAHQMEVLRLRIASLESFTTPEALPLVGARYDAALRNRGDDPWLRYNHGLVLSDAGNAPGAATEFRAFLDFLPQDVPGREKLATALAEQGLFEEALSECRTVIELAPGFSTPYYTLAYALARLGRFDESIDVYEQLLAVDRASTVQIFNEIGRVEIHRERFAEAAIALGRAIEHNTRNGEERIPDVFYNYGFALKRSGKTREARDAFLQAAEWYRGELVESGESAPLHVAIGRALVESGDPAKAVPHFRDAVRLDSLNLDGQFGLLATLEALGRWDAAEAAAGEGIRALRSAGLEAPAAQLQRRLESHGRASRQGASNPQR